MMRGDILGVTYTDWMKTTLQLALLTALGSLTATRSASAEQESARNPRQGQNLIETPVYTAKEDNAALTVLSSSGPRHSSWPQ